MAVMCATAKVNKVKEKRSADKRREEKRGGDEDHVAGRGRGRFELLVGVATRSAHAGRPPRTNGTDGRKLITATIDPSMERNETE